MTDVPTREAFVCAQNTGVSTTLTAEVPHEIRTDPDPVASCIAGGRPIDWLERILTEMGFESVNVSPKDDSDAFIRDWDTEENLNEFLVSATITARKPQGTDE